MKHAYILVPVMCPRWNSKGCSTSFNCDGLGAIINASRSIMFAYTSDTWKDNIAKMNNEAARAEVLRMRWDTRVRGER